MAPRKNVNKLVDGLVEARKTRTKKAAVPTVLPAVNEAPLSAEQLRAAKEAALAPCLAKVAANASELADTAYVKHIITEPEVVSQTTAGAFLDERCIQEGVLTSTVVAAGVKTNAFTIEVCDAVPAEIHRPRAASLTRVPKYNFWKDLLDAKKADPSKFVSIFIPNIVDAKGEEKEIRASMLHNNRKYNTDSGFKFMCKGHVRNVHGATGCRVYVEATQYVKRERPTRNFNPADPIAHLPKLVRELYRALVAAKYPAQVNEPAGMSGVFYTVKHATVNVSGLSVAKKQIALGALQKAGVFFHRNDVVGEVRVI